MKKIFRTWLVIIILVSSITTISVSAAPDDPNAPAELKIYIPLISKRPVLYNISGTVTDGSNNPITGVTITDKDGNSTTTNASGQYTIASTPGSNSITAEKDGYSFMPSVLDVAVNSDTPNQNFRASAACIQGIADPGFEVGGWWILAGGAGYNNLNRHDGTWSARTGLISGMLNTWGYSYVRTPLINVPVGTTTAILRMWVYTESGEPPTAMLPSKPIGQKLSAPLIDAETNSLSAVAAYDAQYVMVLNSSDAILEIVQWDRRNEQTWQPRQFDLTKWAGQSIKVEIGTYNDGQDFTTAMYVDDVSLAMCNDPVPPPPVCSQQVANPSFEFNGNWTIQASAYPAGYSTTFASSGFRSMRLGIPLETFSNVYSFSQVYQTISIPVGTTYARFSFWRLLRSEEPYTPASRLNSEGDIDVSESPLGADEQYVRIFDSTGTVLLRQLVYERGSNSNNLVWKQNVYDLTAYAGQTIRIVFGVYNDGLNGRTVMYIDDVNLDSCTGIIPPPPPPPPPALCVDIIGNGSFESNSDWYIPATAYSAGYTSLISRTGFRSMRTGIYYPAQNRYSYSDFGQYIYVPPMFDLSSSATLNYYEFTAGGDGGNDIQYLLVLDFWGNWIDTLRWQSRGDYYWRQRTIDLSAYGDWLIRLHWGTYNNGWGQVTSMTIDDVSLIYCP